MRVIGLFLFIYIVIYAYGCAGPHIYVDTDEVPGLGVEVSFPTGSIKPIKIRRVISGSIIELTNGETVSYIGVYIPGLYNIPEAARELNEKLVFENDVRLEFDKRRRDSKGNLLAYAYAGDGRLINAEIIRKGLGKVFMAPPNIARKKLLLRAEEEARKAARGIWSAGFNAEERKRGFQ